MTRLPERLLVGRLPTDSPETPLVLAGVAAFNGLRCDGAPMPEAQPRVPTLRDVARLLGVGVDAVRRGVRELAAAGELRVDGGLRANPDALRARWHDDRVTVVDGVEKRTPAYRFRLRLTPDILSRGLKRCEPLLVAALAAGQINDRVGRLCLGVPFIAERTGLGRRTVERQLKLLRKLEVLHSWKTPTKGGGFRQQLFLALGPAPAVEERRPAAAGARGEEAAGQLRRGGRHRGEEAAGPSRRGGRVPDGPPDSVRIGPPDARERASRTHEAQQSPSERIPAVAQALFDDTHYRSDFEPEERRGECFKRAVLLSPTAIEPDQIAEVLLACQRAPGVRDPDRLFAALMDRAAWREFLDRQASLQRHLVALGRGAATRTRDRDRGPYGGPEPLQAASVRLPTLLPRSSPA